MPTTPPVPNFDALEQQLTAQADALAAALESRGTQAAASLEAIVQKSGLENLAASIPTSLEANGPATIGINPTALGINVQDAVGSFAGNPIFATLNFPGSIQGSAGSVGGDNPLSSIINTAAGALNSATGPLLNQIQATATSLAPQLQAALPALQSSLPAAVSIGGTNIPVAQSATPAATLSTPTDATSFGDYPTLPTETATAQDQEAGIDPNELGAGNPPLVEDQQSGIDPNELAAGNPPLVEDQQSGIDPNELGAGNPPLVQDQEAGIDPNELGAGNPPLVQPQQEGVDPAEFAANAGVGQPSLSSLNTAAADTAAIQQGLGQTLRNNQTIRDQRMNRGSAGDWRVRLRLAPRSNYLYNAPGPGILQPLKVTDGVIFPYTPTINTSYKANYTPYDLTHSNYRGYFYQNSAVEQIGIKGTFTAQDTNEADYLLAVIHFFRSVTKMFYGQDALRGAPPPLVYLSGFGQFQFNEAPCVVSNFSYNLPADVNYIRAGSNMANGTNLLNKAIRQSLPTNPLSGALQRLFNAGMSKGALPIRIPTEGSSFGIDGKSTYVPTKMEIDITLLPVQSRKQVSQQFSLENFANGNLIKGGFW